MSCVRIPVTSIEICAPALIVSLLSTKHLLYKCPEEHRFQAAGNERKKERILIERMKERKQEKEKERKKERKKERREKEKEKERKKERKKERREKERKKEKSRQTAG